MYNLADPADSTFIVRRDRRRVVTLNYDAPLTTDYWEPDGTLEFKRMIG